MKAKELETLKKMLNKYSTPELYYIKEYCGTLRMLRCKENELTKQAAREEEKK